MGVFIVRVTSGASVGTIENQIDVGFRYTDKLNAMNEAEIKISGLGSVKRGLLTMGATIEILRNGTLEFKGLLDKIDTLDAGGENIHVSGEEIRLVQEKGTYANSPWVANASADTNFDIISESSYWTDGVINAGVNLDFRLDKAQSLWNALGNLASKTGQDIQLDYANGEVDILDHRGSTTSVATLNDGIQIKNIRVSTGYPRSNSVKVYGKGDGDNLIESDDAQGQDATSKSTYGTIMEVIIDKSIISIDEANSRANIEVAKLKDPIKIYDFEVTNPGESISTGDVVTLNSHDKDLSNEEVRVVGIERGIAGDKEYMTLQVTNTGFSEVIKTGNQMLGQIQKGFIDNGTYMKGSGNTLTWARGLNAKDSVALVVAFEVPAEYIEDEVGTIRVNSFTVDYDVDPYKKGVGGATDSGHDHSDPIQTSSAYTLVSDQGSDIFTATVATSWDQVMTEQINGTFDFVYVDIEITEDSWSGTDTIGIKMEIDGTAYVQDIGIAFDTAFSPFKKTYVFPLRQSVVDDVDVFMYSAGNNDYDGEIVVYGDDDSHNHTVAQHAVDAGNASVSIGDDVSDAGSINATEVDIYLDFWSGSAWVNKHSILNTGETLEQNVDITDSGTYPDAVGFWRVRIFTDNSDADYVQAIVKMRHLLDNS